MLWAVDGLDWDSVPTRSPRLLDYYQHAAHCASQARTAPPGYKWSAFGSADITYIRIIAGPGPGRWRGSGSG